MSRRITLLALALALPALVLLGPVALAGKPGGGGGTGGGTIYFTDTGISSMASDGSGKTALPGVDGEPSYALHGGQRWFLGSRATGGTYPDGSQREELFAVREDGFVGAQLTNYPDVKPMWRAFGRDDSFFSYSGVDWSAAGGPVSRLFRVGLAYDAAGNPSASGPPVVVVTLPTVDTYAVFLPFIREHDWSPAGTQVAWTDRTSTPAALRVTTGASTATLANGARPSWSPDGTKVAFEGGDGIYVIAPDGTGLKRILRDGPRYSVLQPEWSPTGSHIAYVRDDWSVSPRVRDLYRATASGSSPTNLTADIPNIGWVAGWR